MAVNYSDIEQVFALVNAARAKEAKATGFPVPPVDEAERAEAYRWADGQELRNVIDNAGYEIIINKLEKAAENAIKDLLYTLPSDKDAVLAKHAVAYSIHTTREWLINDIKADLAAAENVPEIIKQGTRIARRVPSEVVSNLE